MKANKENCINFAACAARITSIMKKYGYSTDGGEWFRGRFASKEEAIKEGRASSDNEDIHIGEIVGKTIGEYLTNKHVECLLESIAEQAGDECGDVTESWLTLLSMEELSNLKRAIQALLEKWATRTGHQPEFYHVENTEQVKCNRKSFEISQKE